MKYVQSVTVAAKHLTIITPTKLFSRDFFRLTFV